MQYLLLVYIDPLLLEAAPPGRFDTEMRECLQHADALKQQGTLLGSQQLEEPDTAKSVRVRAGKARIVDGPFAETKEVLAGYNLIEAESLDEAVRIAERFPWIQYGCVEVRPIRDMDAVRRRVGV